MTDDNAVRIVIARERTGNRVRLNAFDPRTDRSTILTLTPEQALRTAARLRQVVAQIDRRGAATGKRDGRATR